MDCSLLKFSFLFLLFFNIDFYFYKIFIFHENTNIMRGVRQDRVSSSVKAKVRPPRLDGAKVGLFSTRTPHRPNPIGLSIAKVERIEGLMYSGSYAFIFFIRPSIAHFWS